MDDDKKVERLPVKHREQTKGRVLEMVRPKYNECQHTRFIIDTKLAKVMCRDCSAQLDPMYALSQLANQETKYHDLHERYQDEMGRLKARVKTKCQHCGHMTRISDR